MVQIIERSQWGARDPRGPQNTITAHPKGTAVHWDGAPVGVEPNHALCAPAVRGVQDFHMDTRGWADIAYNFLACPHGYVFVGRGLDHGSAANGSTTANEDYYAVMGLVGTGEAITPAMVDAIRGAIAQCQTRAGSAIVGHRDLYPTECPGDELYALVTAGKLQPTASTPGTGTGGGSTPGTVNLTGHDVRSPHVKLIDLRNVHPYVTAPGLRALQRLLGVKDDGLGGPNTQAALKAAQGRAGVTADAIFGPDTAEAFLAGKGIR